MREIFYFCIAILFYNLKFTKAHYTQQWAVHIQGGKEVAEAVASDHGFINHGLIFDDHYHFSHSDVVKRSLRPNVEKRAKLAVDTRVSWAQQQRAKRRVKRDLKLQDSDPKWPYMWYLNRGGGLDMNVIPAWMEGITGKGAVVTILDDGLEKDHPDLLQNYDPMASYDVNGQDSDPSPRYDMIDSNRHGTRCAGEVAATSNNSVCALGVAHGAQVGGVRMLDGEVTDAVEARSLSLNPHHIDIYSASWGPDDDGKTVDGPGELAMRAFIEGVTKGRNGKGSIFVWASGNGGRDHDNCNCDGYTNSIYTLSISSVTENGHVPWYSEACSSTLASTYSSGSVGEKQVITTDLKHSCTSSHTGTSASAPLAAGICALALEANPNLTWRDMQHIVVRTARPHNIVTGDWQTNGVGRRVSHSFGYGLMDAYAMVQLAKNWTTVPEQHHCEVTAQLVPKHIPPKSMITLQLQVKECVGVDVLEHVQAKLTIFSQRRGDLKIQLTSPLGTKVVLLANRPHDNSRAGFNVWPFMSVHSWGESPYGTWQLDIHNDGRLLGRASLQNWTLVLYGTRYFVPSLTNEKTNKHKSGTIRRKNKKHKNKNTKKWNSTTRSPMRVPAKNSTNNNNALKNRKPSVSSSDVSPYFYAVSNYNNNRIRLDQNSVKQYLKFVKNITITYPVMIPARSFVKNPNQKKTQKLKEKSRDINSNRNLKLVVNKSNATTIASVVTATETVFTAKSTQSTRKDSTGEVKSWQLTLYGTSTPPAYDLQGKAVSTNTIPDTISDDILLNSIYDSSSNWESGAENRKDILEVEEKETSGCSRYNGNLCLECLPNYQLHKGICVRSCPDKFYNSLLDLGDASIDILSRNQTCLSCHYTCKNCKGSLDSDCLECFSDAKLVKLSDESYCYPVHLIPDINTEIWYYRFFVILCIAVLGLTAAVIFYCFCVKKKKTDHRKVNYDIVNQIGEIENDMKSNFYSDND